MRSMKENQKRVRLSTFHEKLKNMVRVLKEESGFFSQGSGSHSEVPLPRASASSRKLLEMQILRPHSRPLNQMLEMELSTCVLISPPGDSDVKVGELLH